MNNLVFTVRDFIFTFFTLNLTSFHFFITLGVVLIAYYILPQKHRWTVLLCANILFVYAISRKKCFVIMGLMFFTVWCSSLLFGKFSSTEKRKKIILLLTLCFNVGLLVLLKDAVFFTNLFNISPEKIHLSFLQKLAPIGISYWCLNSISYLLDCYWGSIKPEKNFAKFVTYAGFFPLFVSGPIVRFYDSAKEILQGHKFCYGNFLAGIQRIIWGIFKKLVISERVAIIVNTVYGDFETYQGFYIWVAIFCFCIQLYTDFSGCIDIVLGVARLFGIKLPENFDFPFLAKNLSEFWRRWHITLGLWLKDYVFYPILKSETWYKFGGLCKKIFPKKIAKKIPVWCGLFISWFLIGFWHGGAWNFIIGNGLYMWALIVLGELLEPIFKNVISFLHVNTSNAFYKIFQQVRTILFFMFGLGFFRSNSFMSALKMYKNAFCCWNPQILFDGSLLNLGVTSKGFGIIFIGIFILLFISFIKLKKESLCCKLKENKIISIVLSNIMILLIYIMGMTEASSFIYFQF